MNHITNVIIIALVSLAVILVADREKVGQENNVLKKELSYDEDIVIFVRCDHVSSGYLLLQAFRASRAGMNIPIVVKGACLVPTVNVPDEELGEDE